METSAASAGAVCEPNKSRVAPTEQPATFAGTATTRSDTGTQREATRRRASMVSVSGEGSDQGKQRAATAEQPTIQPDAGPRGETKERRRRCLNVP